MELEPTPAWTQRTGERDREYQWFIQYAETIGERDLERVAARIGVAASLLRAAAEKNQWDARCVEFDKARMSIARQVVPDDSEALSMQYAVGIAMIRLGVQAVQLKNPALLNMDQVIKLVTQGSEMARRGAGVADLKIEQTVQQRIEREFLDLLGG
jgi:hypothetical protein